MAIHLINKPSDWGRVWDTNRLTYTFSGSNWTQPNFQFQFLLQKVNYDNSIINLGWFNLYPNNDGMCEFNPASIYRNYLSYDFNASDTNLMECFNGASKFRIIVFEFFSNPPTAPPSTQVLGSWGGPTYGDLILYNGVQQNIPYDYFGLNVEGNLKWVMSGSTSGQFLTDATEYRLDNDDLAFLYFISNDVERPTKIRYTLHYNCMVGIGVGVDPGNILPYLGMTNIINDTPISTQSTAQNSPKYNLDKPSYIVPSRSGICSATYYDTNLDYTSTNSYQYRFPMGPFQMFSYGIFPSSYIDNWLYYEIDLLDDTTVLNKNPFYVYNICEDKRFGQWQLTWLNPHGGFDCFTFTKKNDINYKLKKSTYKRRIPASNQFDFSTYDAGERVFMSDVEQEITLRTSNLTQKESQILNQLSQSPRVYVNSIYEYAGSKYPFGVPYIVTNSEIKYEQKINDKEIFMEIKIRPSNQNILQND